MKQRRGTFMYPARLASLSATLLLLAALATPGGAPNGLPSQSAARDLIRHIVSVPGNVLRGTKDSTGHGMDAMQVMQDSAGEYLAVYHNTATPDGRFGVQLAVSSNLSTWSHQVLLDQDASQGFLAEEPDHSYVLADELAQGVGGQSSVHFLHYADYDQLIAGSVDAGAVAGRTLSQCNEGTPDIRGISANGTLISVGFHYNSGCDSSGRSHSGLDREAFGTLRNFTSGALPETYSWTTTADTVRDDALVAAGYLGKHGARQDISWRGYRFSLQEAQISGDNINSTANTGSQGFRAWRLALYDYQTHAIYPVPLVTGSGSFCFGNPRIAQLKSPSGARVLGIGVFLFRQCRQGRDASGETFYTVPLR